MKKKKQPGPAVAVSKVTLQVVSVTISNSQPDMPYIDGLTFLQEEGFLSIVRPKNPSQVEAQAPNEADRHFIVVEYEPTRSMSYMPFSICIVRGETKRTIDMGKSMFRPEENGRHVLFSAKGDEVPSWDIVAQKPSAEILAKLALFENPENVERANEKAVRFVEKRTDTDPNVQATWDVDSPIQRKANKNVLFEAFIREKCDGKTDVMSVSNGLAELLKSKAGMTVLDLARHFGEKSAGLFQDLIEIQKLHPDLQKYLDVTLREKKIGGKERITIGAGALLSKIPPENQVAAWNEAKGAGSFDRVLTKIHEIGCQFL